MRLSTKANPHLGLGRPRRSRACHCVIIDLSDDGAQLVSVTGAPLPDKFTLQVDETHRLYRADTDAIQGRAGGLRKAYCIFRDRSEQS
jgi:hypothetical protein